MIASFHAAMILLAFSPILTHSRVLSTAFSCCTRRKRIQPCRPSSFSLDRSNRLRKQKTALYSSSTEINTLVEGIHTSEQTIKKSRFIGIATKCTNWNDAQTFLEQIHSEHPKARHVCFGLVAGVDSNPGGVVERCSDDGEPTGTGGVPILGGIKGEGLSDTLCAVVRYSGGIKLGAGGLIRAYGGTARLVLRDAPTEILIPTSTIRLSTPSSNAGCIYDAARKFNGITSDEQYGSDGNLEISVSCESKDLESMMECMKDSTRGDVEFLD